MIAVDLRGHGGSEKVPSGHTIPQYGRDLDAFMRALDVEQPVLLGWSMGAFVIFDYVRQFGTGSIRGVVDRRRGGDGLQVGGCSTTASWTWRNCTASMSDIQDDHLGFLQHLVPLMFHHEQSPCGCRMDGRGVRETPDRLAERDLVRSIGSGLPRGHHDHRRPDARSAGAGTTSCFPCPERHT